MAVLHDLICKRGHVERGVLVSVGEYGRCRCGAARTWMPAGFNTDVFGSETYSDAAHRSFTSQRQKDRYMREHGYEPCGDKVGGSRPELKINGTYFSGGGTSTQERRQ